VNETVEGYSICLNIIWLSLPDLNKITRFHKDCKSYFGGIIDDKLFVTGDAELSGKDGMKGHKTTADCSLPETNAAWLNNKASKEQSFPALFLGCSKKLQDEMSLRTSAPTSWRIPGLPMSPFSHP